MQKVEEALLEELEVAAMGRQMIVVDVGYDGDQGLQTGERGVALVGFGDEITTGSEARIAACALEETADDEGGILATLRQDAGYETGGSRLAMRAGNGYGVAEAHQLGKHFRTRYDRNALLQRGVDLGIAARNCAGHNNYIGPGNILSGVTQRDARAHASEPFSYGARLHVGALHRITEV